MDLGALHPAGDDARRIAEVFWWMTWGSAAVWAVVVALAIYATYFRHPQADRRKTRRLVVWGGAVVPAIVLAGLLVYGLAMMPPMLAPAPAGTLRVHVTGEQWWWRVRYLGPGPEPFDLANELWLPVGRQVELELDTRDVIHSLWIPALAGKMDMIPGRRTRLRLQPARTGLFRGICAEYCGGSHAWMLFTVRVVEEEEFARWVALQASAAAPPREPAAARGGELFLANGCGACHAVRGTPADGRVGPDLTHVGGRHTLAAGRLPNDAGAFERWIARPDALKPNVHMPAFGMLAAEDLRALAVYLEELR
jgi:cytochrome c oxidase subunit 2